MMKRRVFLGLSIASILLMPWRVLSAVRYKSAADAVDIDSAEDGLVFSDDVLSNDIDIMVPSCAKMVPMVPMVQVAIHSRIPNTEAMAIYIKNNATALIANTMFSHGALPSMVTRIKMTETSDIKVVVKAGDRYFTVSKKSKTIRL